MASTKTVRDVMTSDLVCCESKNTIADAARMMRDHEIGNVLVVDSGRLSGIVTDRDLVVRCLAADATPDSTLADAFTSQPRTVAADCTVDQAAKLMGDAALRRLPVVDGNKPVGIVTLGDLAMHGDRGRALGEISAAAPNN